MNDERWFGLLEQLEKMGSTLEKTSEPLEPGGLLERVEFESPIGKLRLERTTRPMVLDKKVHYSKRAGAETQVEYVFSDTEVTRFVKLFKWDHIRQGWVQMPLDEIMGR